MVPLAPSVVAEAPAVEVTTKDEPMEMVPLVTVVELVIDWDLSKVTVFV